MHKKGALVVLFLMVSASLPVYAAEKLDRESATRQLTPVGFDPEREAKIAATYAPVAGTPTEILAGPVSRTRDFCDLTGAAFFYMTDWYSGLEWWANYQDPEEFGCVDVWPFQVTEIGWEVGTDYAIDIDVQGFVYSNDGTPSCPLPGTELCATPVYTASIPDAGYWRIWMPLEDTCCVEEPYFAVIYIYTDLQGTGSDPVCEDDASDICRSYNDYGTGWEDLVADHGWPGEMMLYSRGYTSPQNSCAPPPACYTIDTSRPEWLAVVGQFIRGDATNNGVIDIADVVYLLNYLFKGEPPPSCMDAGDANDDGMVDLGDAVYLLNYLFKGMAPPPSPCCVFPDSCGPDPTEDEYDCWCHQCFFCSKSGPLVEEAKGENKVVLGKARHSRARMAVPVYIITTQPLSAFSYDLNYDPGAVMEISVDNASLISADFDFSEGWVDEKEGVVKVGNVVSLTVSETLPPGEYQVATIYITPRKGMDAALTVADQTFIGETGLKIEPKSEKKFLRAPRFERLFAPSVPELIIDHGDPNISDAHESFMDRGLYDFQDAEVCVVCEAGKDCPFVNLINGNLMVARTDFSIPGRGLPLDLTFTYNSGSFFDGRYGYGWQLNHNLRYATNNINGNVIIVREDDRTDIFVEEGSGSFKPTYGVTDSLSQEAVGYILTTKHGVKYYFDDSTHHYVTRKEDLNGNSLTYAYNDDRQLTSVTDACGRQLVFEYQDNKLTRVTDPKGRQVSFGYDGYDDLRWVSNALGDTTRYEYYTEETGCHDLKFITDPLGNQRTIAYNSEYQVETIATCCGTKMFSYGLDTLTTIETDENGHSTVYKYNEEYAIAEIKDALGNITTLAWDEDYNKTGQTDANGNITQWTHDSKGNVLTEVNALGDTTWYTWHPVFNKMTGVTDANGHTTTYEYDSVGNMVGEINPLGDSTIYTYDSHGLMLSQTNARGYATSFDYNDCGDQIRTIDALGCSTIYFPDSVGNDTLVIDANGNPTRYEYDGLDRLIQTIDALGCATSYSYDANSNVTTQVNANGDTTKYEYDELDRLIRTVDALGGETRYGYDSVGNRTSETNCKGDTTRYEYDQVKRLMRIIDAEDYTTSFAYDSVGNRVSETDANGHTTTYEYDELNRLVRTMDALVCSTTYAYDPAGNRISATDANGKTTHYRYDTLDRLWRTVREMETRADSAVTEYEYDEVGNRTAVIDPNGNRIEYGYSERDELIEERNPEGESILYGYDCGGNRTEETRPNGNLITYHYNEKSQLDSISDLIGQVASYTYDCVGNRLIETDANNHTTTYEYDALNRLVKVTDPMGDSTIHTYDCLAFLNVLTDRNGKSTAYTYDHLSRLISTTNALGDSILYEYDGVNNVTRMTDGNGNATTYEYDEVNRLVREIYADSTTREFTHDCVGNILTREDQLDDTTTYEYDDLYYLTRRDYPDANDDQFTYDKGGRLLTAQNAYSFITFVYDSAGRVLLSTQNGDSIQYSYDVANGQRTVFYPSGKVIIETRDLRDRLADIEETGVGSVAVYEYDHADRLLSKSDLNGTVANYHYNANDWMDSLTHERGATLVAGFAYGFDNEGNREYAENLVPFNPTKQYTHSEKYDYDDIYRLVDFKTGQLIGDSIPSPIKTRTWTLDPVNNWSQFTIDAVAYQNTPNQMNEYDDPSTDGPPPVPDDDGMPDDFKDPVATPGADGFNRAHDKNGNLVDDDVNTYEYDYENRLIRVIRKYDGDTLGEYRYDALSRRIEKDTSGVISAYLYDDWRVIEEHDTGLVEAEYVYGDWIDEVLTTDRGGQKYYYHANHLGSAVALTDSSGSALERYAYDAYGKESIMDGAGTPLPNSAVGNPHMFTGRRYDPESQLYYEGTRYQDPTSGRFLTRLGTGIWSNPANVGNGYTLSGSNPLTSLHPAGGQETPYERVTRLERSAASRRRAAAAVGVPGLILTFVPGLNVLGAGLDFLAITIAAGPELWKVPTYCELEITESDCDADWLKKKETLCEPCEEEIQFEQASLKKCDKGKKKNALAYDAKYGTPMPKQLKTEDLCKIRVEYVTKRCDAKCDGKIYGKKTYQQK